jgi:hypothetical protein
MQVWIPDCGIVSGRPMNNDALIVSGMEIRVANTSRCICRRPMNNNSLRITGVKVRIADARWIISWHAVNDDALVIAGMHMRLRPFDITPRLQVGIAHFWNVWLWIEPADLAGVRRNRATCCWIAIRGIHEAFLSQGT